MKYFTVVVGIIALVLGYWYLNDGVDVYQAQNILPARSKISEHDVIKVRVPKSFYHPQMILANEDISGSFIDPYALVLKDDILRHEHVIIGDASQALWLKPEERAVALKSDLIMSQGNTLRPMDVVDISMTHKNYSGVLIRNARVLFVKDRNGSDAFKGVPHLVSVLVNQDHVQALLQAQERGKLSFQRADATDRSISSSLDEESVKRLYD